MLNSRRRLAIAVISVFVSIFGLVAIQAWLHGQRYLNLRQNELIRIVDVAIAGLRPIIKAYNDGKIGYYQARQQVLRQIHDLGYQEGGDTNVFFVGTYDLVPMPLPQLPYSIHSVQVLSAMVEIARSPNANGFVRYNTSPEKTGNRISRRTRLAYLQGIPELELYVGTGLFTSDIRESILLAVLHSLVFGLIFASVSVGILIKSLRPVSNISWVLSEIFTRIAEDPNESLDTVYPEQLKWIEGQAIYNGLSRMLNSLRTARFKQEESEDRFRRLFSDSRDAIILTNGLQILECNQQAVKCFDKRRDELVGSDIRSLLLLSPSLADTMVDDILDRAVDGETVSASLILPARASEQSERTYELSIHPQYLGMEFGFQVVLHDITSIRQSERMLQNLNENLYRTLYSIGDGVITTDPDGIITRMNRVAEDLTEWNQEEAVGRRLQEVVQLRDINTGAHVVCSLEIILEIARDSNDGVSGEAREMITRRGRKRFVSENGAPIRTADYAISGGVVVFRDISNQLSMQRELHESQRILAMVLDNAPIGVGAFTRRGEFMYANPMLCQMLGYSAMQLRRQRFDAMVHQDDLRRNLRSFRRLMMGTKSESFEIRYLTRSGELRYAELSGGGVDAEQVHDRQGFVVVIIQDITDIKRAERESLEKEQLLIQAEKLAALGELSAGMAHEINQPLTGISMAADNLQLVATGQIPDRLISPGYVREKTEHIHEYIDRIRSIIEHVRTFSREQMRDEIHPFDPNQAVSNALSLVNSQYKGLGIELTADLNEMNRVSGNLYRLEQVILNLLTNARDAVDERISAEGHGFHPRILVSTFTKCGSVEKCGVGIRIEDNGAGIPEEHLTQIFDPFFTTKPVDKGTGLGLSVAYGIIKEMGGEILYESRVGEGTIATIKLPALAATE